MPILPRNLNLSTMPLGPPGNVALETPPWRLPVTGRRPQFPPCGTLPQAWDTKSSYTRPTHNF